MNKSHLYNINLKWTGNKGTGTSAYRDYKREHVIMVNGKPDILASSDVSFRGDADRYNPEELFVASVASCHMLWYLHLCAVNGVTVMNYSDKATGTMIENPDGNGRFTEITLHPEIVVKDASMIEKAKEFHHQANKMCFIANSLNFEVKHEPAISAIISSTF